MRYISDSFLGKAALFFVLLLTFGISPLAAQDYTSNAGDSACDGTFGDADCWDVTGPEVTADGIPNDPGESVKIKEGDGLQILNSSFSIDDLTIENTDSDPTNDLIGVYQDSLVVNGDLTLGGTIDMFDSFDGGGNLRVTRNLTISGDLKVKSKTLTVQSSIAINSGGSLESGNTGVIKIGANFTNNGSFTSADGTVKFIGNSLGSAQSLDGDFTANNPFYNVIIGNDGSTGDEKDPAEVDPDDTLTITNNSSIIIEGNLTVLPDGQYGSGTTEGSDVTFTGNSFEVKTTNSFFANKVKFNPSSTNITVKGVVFSNVDVIDGTVLLEDTFEINGDLLVGSTGTLDISGGILTLNGDAQFDGTLDPLNSSGAATGGITFSSGATQSVGGATGSDLNLGNLTVTDDAGGNATTVNFPQVSSALLVNNLTINGGSTLDLGRRLEVTGDFTNDGGTFTFKSNTDETILFNGGGTQTISSTTGFNVESIEINNQRDQGLTPPDVTVEAGSDLDVTRELILSRGRLQTNSALTLLSGARVIYNSTDGSDGDTLLDNISITDDALRMNRALRGAESWIFVTPLLGDTYEGVFEEQKAGYNDLWVQGPANSDVPSASFSNSSLFYYDETTGGSQDNGWTVFGDMASTADPSKGTLIYTFADDNNDGTNDGFPKVLDATGTPSFESSTTINGTFTNTSAADTEDGWNLFANPYANIIDWDALTTTNLDGVIYVYDAADGAYATYNGGPDNDGTAETFDDEGLIAPFQSFFVKANGTGPGLTIDIATDQFPSVDSTLGDTFLPKSREAKRYRLVRLEMTMDGLEASTRASFQPTGQKGWDRLDAYQLEPPANAQEGLMQLHSVLDNGTALAINNLPYDLQDGVDIPVAPTLRGCDGNQPYSGTARIAWDGRLDIPDTWGVFLKDTKTGETIDLRAQPEYEFTLTSSTPSSVCSPSSVIVDGAGPTVATPPPTPTVVKHPVAKDGSGPKTRFVLTIDPTAGPLPVELSSFTAEADGQEAVLSWQTASETNNAGFAVQRKTPSGTFEQVAFVEGAGTTTAPQTYRFRTEALTAGTHTFRLRQVDTDGTASFSDPVTVQIGLRGAFTLTAYPNPVRRQATVEFAVKQKGEVTLTLYNTLGQKVRTVYRGTPPAEQTQRVQVETGGLASGLYLLRMTGNGVATTQRLTVVQ